GAAGSAAAPRRRWIRLEDELSAQFEHAWILRAGDLAEGVAAAPGGAEGAILRCIAHVQVVRFGVVEGVERLEAEFEVRPLSNGKRLVERGGEVDTARTDDRVLAGVAEAEVGAAL